MRGRRTADSILLTSDNNNPNNDHPTTNSSTVPAGANHTDEALVLVGDPQTPCPPDWVEVWQCPEAGCGELAASDRLLARHIRMVSILMRLLRQLKSRVSAGARQWHVALSVLSDRVRENVQIGTSFDVALFGCTSRSGLQVKRRKAQPNNTHFRFFL